MNKELKQFLKDLKANEERLTRHQYKTFRGQAIAGDIDGARKGMKKMLERLWG